LYRVFYKSAYKQILKDPYMMALEKFTKKANGCMEKVEKRILKINNNLKIV